MLDEVRLPGPTMSRRQAAGTVLAAALTVIGGLGGLIALTPPAPSIPPNRPMAVSDGPIPEAPPDVLVVIGRRPPRPDRPAPSDRPEGASTTPVIEQPDSHDRTVRVRAARRVGPDLPLAEILGHRQVRASPAPQPALPIEPARADSYGVYLRNGEFIASRRPPRFERRAVLFEQKPTGALTRVSLADVDGPRTSAWNRGIDRS